MQETDFIDINDYNYALPDNRIARYPLDQRDASKLLVYRKGEEAKHYPFKEIGRFLPENALLVYNNTKVIHARLEFKKQTGARIEIFCLSPDQPTDYQQIFTTTEECQWNCMVGNRKKWKDGILENILDLEGVEVKLKAELINRDADSTPVVKFSWDRDVTFAELLETMGEIPIPPYLNRNTEQIDATRYQTVYSKHNGSVAAPTAGLHFTEPVINKLKVSGVDFAEVTLHVGAGTFQPVKAENALNHPMHAEQFIVSKQLLRQLLDHKGEIIPVGTTSLRTLESIYWLGVKARNNELNAEQEVLILDQWYWKEGRQNLSFTESLQALVSFLETNEREIFNASTEIMIVPGYKFRVVSGIITNFHQPKSTLLLLISALIGSSWKEVYQYALDNDFRFLSYGDSSLLML